MKNYLAIFILNLLSTIMAFSQTRFMRSISTRGLQYSPGLMIGVQYINNEGDILFYSDCKKKPTPYENYRIEFCGFTQEVKYVKQDDSSGYLAMPYADSAYKIYFLEYRKDSLYLDSIVPDSNQQIHLFFVAEDKEEKTFSIETLKSKTSSTWKILISNDGIDGSTYSVYDLDVLSADRTKYYHKRVCKNCSRDFLFFYAKSFRIVSKKEYDKAARKFK